MQHFQFHRVDSKQGIDRYEDVLPEKWRWEAEYDDGSILKQFDDTVSEPPGIFHQLQEIDQSRLRDFVMRNEETGQRFIMLFPPKAKLFCFYRRSKVNIGTPQEQKFTVYIFGYDLPHYKIFFMITPDDSIIITDDEKKVEIG